MFGKLFNIFYCPLPAVVKTGDRAGAKAEIRAILPVVDIVAALETDAGIV